MSSTRADGWRKHVCDVGHRYQLHDDQPGQTIACPICGAIGGQVAQLPQGVTGGIGNDGKPWTYLRATPQG